MSDLVPPGAPRKGRKQVYSPVLSPTDADSCSRRLDFGQSPDPIETLAPLDIDWDDFLTESRSVSRDRRKLAHAVRLLTLRADMSMTMSEVRSVLSSEFKDVESLISRLKTLGCIRIDRGSSKAEIVGSPRAAVHRALFGN